MTTMLVPQTESLPHAEANELSRPFWEGCARGELLFQRCTKCDAALAPPGPNCRRCLSTALVWERSSGLASLYSWTVVWRPVTPAFQTPYAPAIVDLDEGFAMVTNVVNAAIEDLAADMRVSVTFARAGNLTLPYFEPTRP